MSLFQHEPHPHKPINVNDLHAVEKAAAGFNARLAVMITRALGTMACAYLFMILALIGFPGLNATPMQYVQWVSQTLIQLVALSVLAVGQRILGRHQELQADEQFNITKKNYFEIKQLMDHLDKQDEIYLELLSILKEMQNNHE